MKNTLSLIAVSVIALSAQAQTFSPTLGQGATLDQQVIGDTTATADRTQSTAIQQGNSANQFGNDLGNNVDTRDQNTNNVQGGAGGAAHGNLSSNDNKSSVGNTSSNSGGNNLSNGGNTTGGNVLGGATSGGNTLSNGSSSGGNTTTSAGGVGHGGQGGQGGTASSNGTNLGINGQQQGIDRSGNSTNANTAGGNTGGNSANRNSMTGGAQNSAQATNAGNGAGAGAGSNNRTAMVVEGDRTSYESRAVAWAPVIHGPAAAPLAAGNVIVTPGKCGPRMMVVSRDVTGQRFKSILPDSTFVQTTTDRLVTLTDGNGKPMAPFEVRDGYLMGHEITSFVLNGQSSTAGSISLGIFGKNNDAGQGGSSSSGGVNQIIKEIELRDCVYAIAAVAQPPVIPPMVVVPHNPAVLTPKTDRN